MDISGLLKQLVRSWLGDFNFKRDREKREITLTIGEKTETMTYDQFFDYLESQVNGK